jgi:polyisoprenoid-binding protein YceI
MAEASARLIERRLAAQGIRGPAWALELAGRKGLRTKAPSKLLSARSPQPHHVLRFLSFVRLSWSRPAFRESMRAIGSDSHASPEDSIMNKVHPIPALVAATLVIGSSLVLLSSAAAERRAAKSTHPSRSMLDGLEIFQLDGPHSPIGFTVAWMGLSKVRGAFDDCIGTIVFDSEDITRSSVSILARTPSLHTGSTLRDKDLKGPDWFDVEKFPTALFRSKSIVKDDDGYRMLGLLTIHGTTREIEFPFSFAGRLVQPNHEVRVGFEGHVVVRRREFGLTGPARFNAVTELGKAMIGDEVELSLAIEGWRGGARDTLFDHAADSLARRVSRAGFATAAKEYRELKARTPDSLMVVDEGVLNTLGYAYLEREQPENALVAFQLEVESYPRSAFALTGLTQAYATLGDSVRAVENGTKALALNPDALRALEVLRRVRPQVGIE